MTTGYGVDFGEGTVGEYGEWMVGFDERWEVEFIL